METVSGNRDPPSALVTGASVEGVAAAFSAAVDAMTEGVCLGDQNGFHSSNGAALRLLGATSPQELHVAAGDFVQRFGLRRERGGPLLAVSELPFVRALQGVAGEAELWATQVATGHSVLLRCAAEPVHVRDGVAGVVAVFGDLSERQGLRQTGRDLGHVSAVLQHQSAERRAMLDSVRDYAIFTLSPGGRIQSWHQGAALMKGYTAEEAIGMPFEALFTAEDRAAGLPAREMAVAADTGEYTGDGLRLRKDGSTFDASVVLTPLRSPQGELWGYLKMTRDISQRKSLERERAEMLSQAQTARRRAEHASELKGEFLSTLSHELRTPLSAILGWAQVLQRGIADPQTVSNGLSAISRNARAQVQLIEDLLDMNSLESGRVRLELQRIELGGVIAAAVDAARPSAAARGIGMRWAPHPGALAVLGDPGRLQQVVGHLLNNAIKFSQEGGQVSVRAQQTADGAQLTVGDTGCGIEAGFLHHVFDGFRQQDATPTRRHGGLGIGLAVVRHVVQLHGGTVQAHSAGAGLGSSFTVRLPAASGDVATTPPVPAPAGPDVDEATAGPRLDGVKVLVVDDDDDSLAITARVLKDAGAEVLTAASAERGLGLLRSARPAVLLSDIGMPVVDGCELMRRVRALPDAEGGDVPAAALTAFTQPEDRARTLAAGFHVHLGKPLSPTALVRAVTQLVRHRLP